MRRCRLSDIADINMGRAPESVNVNTDGEGLPFVQGNTDFGVKYPDIRLYTTQQKKIKVAEEGDILLSVRAPVGEMNIASGKTCIGRGLCAIRAKNVSEEFLYYLIKASMPALLAKANGTIYDALKYDDIAELTVYVPDTEETQKDAVRPLSLIDDMIWTNRNIMKNLHSTAMNMYGQLTDPPVSYEKLSDIAHTVIGRSPKSSTVNNSGDGMKFYQGVTGFGFRYPEEKEPVFTTKPTTVAYPDDVLLGVRATVGVVNVAEEQCCVGRGIGVLRSKDNLPSFLLYTVLSLKEKIKSLSLNNTTYASINKDTLDDIEVPIPDRKAMEVFEQQTSVINQWIRILQKKNRSLNDTGKILLRKCMSKFLAENQE